MEPPNERETYRLEILEKYGETSDNPNINWKLVKRALDFGNKFTVKKADIIGRLSEDEFLFYFDLTNDLDSALFKIKNGKYLKLLRIVEQITTLGVSMYCNILSNASKYGYEDTIKYIF